MEEKHRTILRHKWFNIRDDVEPKNLLPKLVTVLAETEEEEIKAQPTRQERCNKLLEILPRKGPNAFKAFVEALKKEAPHLADVLIEADEGIVGEQSANLRGEIRDLKTKLEAEKRDHAKTSQKFEELKSLHETFITETSEQMKKLADIVQQLTDEGIVGEQSANLRGKIRDLKTKLEAAKQDHAKTSRKLIKLTSRREPYKTKTSEQVKKRADIVQQRTARERVKTKEEDLSHRIRKLQMEEKEEPDKVAIFVGTVTSEGLHLDLNEGTIHLTLPPGTVAEPTDIMVYRWKYGFCLPQLEEHEAIVSNVIEISADTEVGSLKFNSEVELVLSHSAAELEGYELVMKRLMNKEKNEWQEIGGCKDIRQVPGTDDYTCPNNVPYSFPVAIASITKCSTYAVVSRLKSSPVYNITVSGGTFVHPGYPQVTITVPQEAVANETRLSLQLKVQEVPQNEFKSHSLFYGPILRVLCSSRATFLQPVTIQLPISLGNRPVNIPQPSECRVRIFFLSPEREPKEWVEISDKLEAPASYDGKLVKFKVQRFSGYFCLLDWISVGSGVAAIVIIDYLSRFISNPPLVANFFAYFDPKERKGIRDILFLICSPAHRSKDVKQELEKAGLKPREATSRRDMIPGRDKAFVFLSGGINCASREDMAGGFYLRICPNKRKASFLRQRRSERLL